jgi:ubiquinone/menaquinone biosynthesis C-methylase UbiE
MRCDYTLTLSDPEVHRYETMCERALDAEHGAWRGAGIRSGARVADVGCGPGVVLIELASMVGPDGEVIGVDQSNDALMAAKDRITAMSVTNAHVQQGTADATGLDPCSVDVVFMRHVLLHNGPRLATILEHLASRLRPGGHLYLAETDLTGSRWESPPEPELADLFERWTGQLARRGNDLQIGPRLGALARAAGLQVVDRRARFDAVTFVADGVTSLSRGAAWAARDELVAEGLATSDDVARWDAAFTRRDARTGTENAIYVPIYTLTARKAGN